MSDSHSGDAETRRNLVHEELTEKIIGAAIEVHRVLGPGLLESAYEECMCHELSLRGLRFQRQVEVPVEYKGVKLSRGFRIDILVEDTVIVEVKAVEQMLAVFDAQLLTYMKVVNKPVGLLLNFHVPVLTRGIHRKVLKEVLRASASPL